MGFRFRKSIKIFPGVKINFSKKGISSVSVGRRGATINFSRSGQTRVTFGIPGTGISYQTRLDKPAGKGLTECPFCGHRMRKQWDACPKCGSSLIQEEAKPLGKEEKLPEAVPEERPQPLDRSKKNSRPYALVLAIMAALLIASCLNENSAEEPKNPPPQRIRSQQQSSAPSPKAKEKSILSTLFE